MSSLRPLLLLFSALSCVAFGAVPAAAAHDGEGLRPLAHAASTSTSSAKIRARHRHRTVARHSTSPRKPKPKAAARHSVAALRSTSKSTAVVGEAAPSLAVTIARVLATPCGNSQLIPELRNLRLVDEAVMCLVNTERAEHGEAPLIANAELERAAEEHGQEMLALDYFDHVAPSGLTPVGRVRSTGYIPSSEVGYVIGENLAWGTLSLATPQAIVNAWIASPGHLANILESKYRETGIGVVAGVPSSLAEGSPGATYTQEFGVIVR